MGAKKVILSGVVVVTLLLLFACGGKEAEKASSPQKDNSQSETVPQKNPAIPKESASGESDVAPPPVVDNSVLNESASAVSGAVNPPVITDSIPGETETPLASPPAPTVGPSVPAVPPPPSVLTISSPQGALIVDSVVQENPQVSFDVTASAGIREISYADASGVKQIIPVQDGATAHSQAMSFPPGMQAFTIRVATKDDKTSEKTFTKETRVQNRGWRIRSGRVNLFKSPASLVVDSLGNIYIADSDSGKARIIKMDPHGFLSQIGSDTEFKDPRALALDAQDNVYVADSQNNCIKKIDKSTQAITTFVESLSTPKAIAFDAEGSLYIADENVGDGSFQNKYIRKVRQGAGAIENIKVRTPFPTADSLAFDSKGKLYAATGSLIQRLDQDSADSFKTTLLFTLPNGNRPATLAIDSEDHLYVTDLNYIGTTPIKKILQVNLKDNPIPTNINTLPVVFDNAPESMWPVRMALDATGALYIVKSDLLFTPESSNNLGSEIVKMDAHGGNAQVILRRPGSGNEGDGGDAFLASFKSPTNLATDAKGHLYIADVGNKKVRKIDADTGVLSTIVTGSSDSTDFIMAVDRGGKIYVAELRREQNVTADKIKKYASDGKLLSTLTFEPELLKIDAIAVDAEENIYVSYHEGDTVGRPVDLSFQGIKKIDKTGGVSEFRLKLFNNDQPVDALAVDSSGENLYLGVSGGSFASVSYGSAILKMKAKSVQLLKQTGNCSIAFERPSNTVHASLLEHCLTGEIKHPEGLNDIALFAGGGSLPITDGPQLATTVGLPTPKAFSFDGSGNLFILTKSSRGILRVSGNDGKISTVLSWPIASATSASLQAIAVYGDILFTSTMRGSLTGPDKDHGILENRLVP